MFNLNELILKKSNMKNVTTIITDVNGRKYETTDITKSETTAIIQTNSSGSGAFFVVDTKPDDKSYRIGTLNLYIGSQDAAFNKSDLQLNNIKSILNVGYGITNLFTQENSSNNDGFIINYCSIDMYDDVDFNIIEMFEKCFNFIDSNLNNGDGAGLLIHCNAGISRSSTVMIAYLMKTLSISLSDAHNMVKQSRSSIKPNNGFQHQLELYEKTLINK